MNPRKAPYRSFLTIICCALFMSCGQPQPASNTSHGAKVEPRVDGKRGGTLTYRLTAAPKTFNYVTLSDEPSMVVAMFMLMSRLVEFDHRTQEYVPGLAESWTTTDGLTYELTLRDGLKFSDGDALTTDDVIFTLNGIYDERTNSPAFRSGLLVDGKPIAARKTDERHMQLVFPKPVAAAESYLYNIGVLPSHKLDAAKLSDAWKIDSPPAEIVASGPFVVESAAPGGERIDFARNPHYYKKDSAGTQLPYLDKLTIEVIPDANNTFVRLSQGTLDIGDRIRPNDFVELAKANGPMRAFDAGPGLAIDHLWFNLNTTDLEGKPLDNATKRAWFADKRFRHAIAHAIDRQTIANVTLQGLATPMYGFVSPGNRSWIAPDLAKIDYDLKKAEQLLSEAGFKKGGTTEAPVLSDAGGNAVEFTVIVPAENKQRQDIAAFIQADLAKLGIKMQVAPIENAKISAAAQTTFVYDAALQGLSQTDTEPSSYANFLLSSAATHQWMPKQKAPATEWEKRIDELFAQQAATRDPAQRHALFAEIQRIMRDEMPVIPLVVRHVTSSAHTKVGNFSPSSIVPYALWNVEELFIK